jgi:magnesium transporter
MILAHRQCQKGACAPTEELEGATWVDLVDPTTEEMERVRASTGLRVPTRDQVSEIESTSRLAFEAGAYYLSTPLVALRADGEHVITPVGFVFSARVLLTVRFLSIPSFEAIHGTCPAQGDGTAESIFLHIFENVVDKSADGLEKAGSECDALADGAFRRGVHAGKTLRATLNGIGHVADRTSRLRDALLGIGRVMAFVSEPQFEGAPRPNPSRVKAIRADIASLTDYEAHLSSKVQFLLDATLGFINVEQNDIVKTLTVASVAGIPPVLVAGIYGMNFRVMPELGWTLGYPFALLLMVVSGLLPVLWFKRRGWM